MISGQHDGLNEGCEDSGGHGCSTVGCSGAPRRLGPARSSAHAWLCKVARPVKPLSLTRAVQCICFARVHSRKEPAALARVPVPPHWTPAGCSRGHPAAPAHQPAGMHAAICSRQRPRTCSLMGSCMGAPSWLSRPAAALWFCLACCWASHCRFCRQHVQGQHSTCARGCACLGEGPARHNRGWSAR